MTRYHPYINGGASKTENLVMDNPNNDTRLVRAGSSPIHQSEEELDRADLIAMDHVDDDTALVRAGSSQTAPGDEELDSAEPIAMDHVDDDTELFRAGSSQTVQDDGELDSAEPMTEDHLDDDTQLFSAGSLPTDLGDDELDHAERRLRLELLANIFADKPVQLKDFDIPPECFQYKDQGSDILSQYLFHTDFNVKVWINFDAHEEVFFESARSAACGKLQLPKSVYQDLATADQNIIKFQQVRLSVGTPFRTLAFLDLTVEHEDDRARLRARGKTLSEHADKYSLVNYMKHCCKEIRFFGLADGADGITFDDLRLFASLFRRDREASPGLDEDWEESKYGGGEWAGVEDPYQTTPTTPTRRYNRILW
jgi:hypothetical protein